MTELANRTNSTFSTGSKASQSSTRKMASSGKYWCMVSFSCREEARSVPNGFSTMTRAPFGPAGRGDALGDPAEQLGRHLHVEQHLLAGADLIGHGLVGGVVAEVPVDVAEQAEHLDRRRVGRVHVVELERGDGVVAELLQAPAALGHPDHRDIKDAAFDQPDQRGEGLDLGQVPGRPEDHQRVNFVGHVSFSLPMRSALPVRVHGGKAGKSLQVLRPGGGRLVACPVPGRAGIRTG